MQISLAQLNLFKTDFNKYFNINIYFYLQISELKKFFFHTIILKTINHMVSTTKYYKIYNTKIDIDN